MTTLTETIPAHEEDTYLLVRDDAESERNIGYIIHPAILKLLPSESRVADVAAGTGAWTLSAAELLSPGSRLDGYDISAAQFPQTHPENVSFSTHNAKCPFPRELHGTYDIVHVRGLTAAMDREDWKRVLANLLDLLKPGGALQWCEGDLSRLRALRSTATIEPFKAIPRLLNAFNHIASKRTGYGIDELPRLFQGAGLRSIEIDAISNDRVSSTRTAFARTYVVAMFGWAKNALGLSDVEMDEWKLDVEKEIEAGAYIRGDTITVIGIKPS